MTPPVQTCALGFQVILNPSFEVLATEEEGGIWEDWNNNANRTYLKVQDTSDAADGAHAT